MQIQLQGLGLLEVVDSAIPFLTTGTAEEKS